MTTGRTASHVRAHEFGAVSQGNKQHSLSNHDKQVKVCTVRLVIVDPRTSDSLCSVTYASLSGKLHVASTDCDPNVSFVLLAAHHDVDPSLSVQKDGSHKLDYHFVWQQPGGVHFGCRSRKILCHKEHFDPSCPAMVSRRNVALAQLAPHTLPCLTEYEGFGRHWLPETSSRCSSVSTLRNTARSVHGTRFRSEGLT